MKAIQTVELSKKYKDFYAVRNLNLEVEEGEVFSLLDVNGAGKTTTIKMLTGLASVTEGDAFVFGKSVVKDTYAVKSMIGISMQETAVARNLTVMENLRFFASLSENDKKKSAEIIDEIVDSFGFIEVLNKRAKILSGGWQRKLSIALSLLSEPKVLFLDEPTLGLDVIARRELWTLISGLRKKMTIILTTHYMEEAEKLSDRIGVMKNGVLLTVGSAPELIEKTNSDSFEDAFVSIIENGEKI